MIKYYDNREIMSTYDNLQIVRSQFFTDKLIFIYIWSNLNIYWLFRYSDLLPPNTREELFSYIQLFVIFGQLLNEQ
jgi:hypothetical protein